MPAITARLAGPRPRALIVLLALLAGLLALAPAPAAHSASSPGPGGWAYGYRDPADPVPAPLHDSWSSAGTIGQVTATGGNTFKVLFPGAGAPGGVVHVTAISTPSTVASWCEPDLWSQAGADEQVVVSCWATSFGLVQPYPTGFSVTFTSKTFTGVTSPDFAYVESDGASGTVTQYDSSGASITSTHVGTGQWQVKVPGVGVSGSVPAGGVSVTGFGPTTASAVRCKLGGWQNASMTQVFKVFCFKGDGNPVDTTWNLTYQLKLDVVGQPSKFFGYVWITGAAPAGTNFNSQAGTGANSVGLSGASYAVKYPLLGPGVAHSTAQASAFGQGPEFCRFGEPSGPPPWNNLSGTLLVWAIDCFKADGSPTPTDVLTTFGSEP